MSFFGALAGLGQGMADEGAYLDKAALARELQAEKNAAAMQLQQQRAQDRQDMMMLANSFRAEREPRGGGRGGSGFNLFQQLYDEAPTPEAKAEVVRSFSGSDAGGDALLGALGKPRMETVNPSAGDFARFDRQADPETGVNEAAVPQSYIQRAEYSKQEGALALQRVTAIAAGKYKDYAEGDARVLGTDAVRGAKDDKELRQAGVVNAALDGKARTDVQGGVEFDKYGVGPSKTTAVGESMIRENNAQAGNAGASAGQHKAQTDKIRAEIGDGKDGTAASKLEVAKARERRLDLQNQINTTINERKESLITKEDAQAKLAELKAQQAKYDKVIKDAEDKPSSTPAPKPGATASAGAPAASGPPKITSQSQYNALRSGTRFIAPDGTTRVKP